MIWSVSGRFLENHPIFPERANISIAEVKAADRIIVRTWERGAGLTEACGSAACAALVCAARMGKADRAATVTLPGGDLHVEWRADDHIIMTGPAEWEFSGRLDPATGEWLRDGDSSLKAGLMGIDIVTFGCRLNTYESEVMRGEAEAAGLGELDGGAIVFNTCAVTGEAVRQARQAIRRARREHPDARIIVTGCAAQTEPASFGAMDEVDLVIGNDDKLKAQSYRALPEFGVNQFEKVRVNDIFEVRETAAHMVDAIEGRARAFVQVQNGCDHRCTFCIIPYGRGNSRSVPMGAVVEQVKRLVENGYREVVLTGVDLTSYGPDLPGQPSLGKLVLSILRQVPELDRLRLSSIDSIEADDALMEAIATEARLMPHFHLSLQHGDNLILKRMKRRHAREDSIRFCEDVRRLRPDAAFGADIIAGFPTESEEHFANSLSIVDECGLAHVHAFPFSPRDGTPAARMPQLPRDVVKDRARRLRAKAGEAWLRHMEQLSGTRQDVLVERENIGRIADFSVVALDGVETAPGSLVPAVITGHDGEMLRGTPALAQAAE